MSSDGVTEKSTPTLFAVTRTDCSLRKGRAYRWHAWWPPETHHTVHHGPVPDDTHLSQRDSELRACGILSVLRVC